MDKKYTLSKQNAVTLVVAMILSIAGLAATIWAICTTTDSMTLFTGAAAALVYCIVIFYSAFGYKVPNNNLVMYAMLVFAVVIGANASLDVNLNVVQKMFYIVAAVLVAFIAGKLKKLEKCRMLSLIVFFILLACALVSLGAGSDASGTFAKIYTFSMLVSWAALAEGYIARYQIFRQIKEDTAAEFDD